MDGANPLLDNNSGRLVLCPALLLGYALSCTTLRVVGITTRSVVQLSLPTHVFNLDRALGFRIRRSETFD